MTFSWWMDLLGLEARAKFIDHMSMFRTDCPWVFDDMQREEDRRAAVEVAIKRETVLQLYRCADGKGFGVIEADGKKNSSRPAAGLGRSSAVSKKLPAHSGW